MGILDMVKGGLRIARSNRSLWLFGFFIGMGSSAGGDDGAGPPVPGDAPAGGFVPPEVVLLVVLVAIVIVAMRVLSEGALIEGVERARRGVRMSVREGFGEGRAHWGAVFLIDAIYVAASAASVALLAAPCLAAAPFIGSLEALLLLGTPAMLVGVPWLVTLYIWQAFATRIAVLENRHATDALRKARLFLHGRLLHGLKLIVASLLGTLLVGLIGAIVFAPIVLVIAGSFEVLGSAALVLALLVGLPIAAVFAGVLGTFQSSVWTLGYLAQAEAPR